MEKAGISGKWKTAARNKIHIHAVDEMAVSKFCMSLCGFALGRTVIFSFYNPIGAAYFVSALGTSFFYPVALSGLLGMFLRGGQINFYKYLGVFILSCLIHGLCSQKKGFALRHRYKLGAVAMVLVGAVAAVISPVTKFYLFVAALEGLGVFLIANVMAKAWPMFPVTKSKLDTENLISVLFITSLVVCGFYDFYYSLLNFGLLLALLLVLFASFAGGPSIGTAAGVGLGLALMLSGAPYEYMILFSVGGLFSGTVKEMGRISVIITFYLSVLGMIFAIRQDLFQKELIVGALSAGILLLLMPEKVFARVKKTISDEETREEKKYLMRAQEIVSQKLENFSESFYLLSKTLKNLSNKKVDTQKDVSKIIDHVAYRVCENCRQQEICWDKHFYSTYESVYGLLNACETKGKIQAEDVAKEFEKRCIRLPEFIEAVAMAYEINVLNKQWLSRIQESRDLVSEQLLGVSHIVGGLLQEIDFRYVFHDDLENSLMNELMKNNVEVDNVIVLENKHGLYEVAIQGTPCITRKKCFAEIFPVVNRVMGRRMRPEKALCTAAKGKKCRFTFMEEQKLRVTTGIARATKNGSQVSGDSYTFMELKDGRVLIALSDGMGSGVKAQEESAAAIELLEQFTESGFDNDLAVKLINSVFVLKSEEDFFCTLDICNINLYNGNTDFIKIGAAETYIVRGESVFTVRSSTLPAGILKNIDMESTSCRLMDGDMVVMVSDGVSDASGGDWMKTLLSHLHSTNPQDVSDYILAQAMKNYGEEAADDMSVLTIKVWERY